MEKYERVRTLGTGSFGKALLVRHKDTRQLCVMKDMKCKTKSDLEEALKESKIHASVSHRNIIQYLEVFQHGTKNVFIVMEYGQGGDLQAQIKRKRTARQHFPEHLILKWLVQMCLALEYLHAEGKIHRDIKAANLFLDSGGNVKLGDFGIARVLEENAARMSARTCKTPVGTPLTMAPEVAMGRKYGQKVDMWGVGCVLYELTQLKPPFFAQSLDGLISRIRRGKYDTKYPDHVSPDLQKLIATLLRVDPKKRPGAARVLAHPLLAHQVAAERQLADAETNGMASTVTSTSSTRSHGDMTDTSPSNPKSPHAGEQEDGALSSPGLGLRPLKLRGLPRHAQQQQQQQQQQHQQHQHQQQHHQQQQPTSLPPKLLSPSSLSPKLKRGTGAAVVREQSTSPSAAWKRDQLARGQPQQDIWREEARKGAQGRLPQHQQHQQHRLGGGAGDGRRNEEGERATPAQEGSKEMRAQRPAAADAARARGQDVSRHRGLRAGRRDDRISSGDVTLFDRQPNSTQAPRYSPEHFTFTEEDERSPSPSQAQRARNSSRGGSPRHLRRQHQQQGRSVERERGRNPERRVRAASPQTEHKRARSAGRCASEDAQHDGRRRQDRPRGGEDVNGYSSGADSGERQWPSPDTDNGDRGRQLRCKSRPSGDAKDHGGGDDGDATRSSREGRRVRKGSKRRARTRHRRRGSYDANVSGADAIAAATVAAGADSGSGVACDYAVAQDTHSKGQRQRGRRRSRRSRQQKQRHGDRHDAGAHDDDAERRRQLLRDQLKCKSEVSMSPRVQSAESDMSDAPDQQPQQRKQRLSHVQEQPHEGQHWADGDSHAHQQHRHSPLPPGSEDNLSWQQMRRPSSADRARLTRPRRNSLLPADGGSRRRSSQRRVSGFLELQRRFSEARAEMPAVLDKYREDMHVQRERQHLALLQTQAPTRHRSSSQPVQRVPQFPAQLHHHQQHQQHQQSPASLLPSPHGNVRSHGSPHTRVSEPDVVRGGGRSKFGQNAKNKSLFELAQYYQAGKS